MAPNKIKPWSLSIGNFRGDEKKLTIEKCGG